MRFRQRICQDIDVVDDFASDYWHEFFTSFVVGLLSTPCQPCGVDIDWEEPVNYSSRGKTRVHTTIIFLFQETEMESDKESRDEETSYGFLS